jgi:hypothetical protein
MMWLRREGRDLLPFSIRQSRLLDMEWRTYGLGLESLNEDSVKEGL